MEEKMTILSTPPLEVRMAVVNPLTSTPPLEARMAVVNPLTVS